MASTDGRSGSAWKAQSAALFIPYTAILHHAVFFPRNCILNKFGRDYGLDTLILLFQRNPAFPWAILAVLLTYNLGLHARFGRFVRLAALPLFLGFLPLSVWVWDIPFLSQPICRRWHDGRLVLPILGPMRSLYLYAFGLLLTAALYGLRTMRAAGARRAAVGGGPVHQGQR
jgi:hypothetical protein